MKQKTKIGTQRTRSLPNYDDQDCEILVAVGSNTPFRSIERPQKICRTTQIQLVPCILLTSSWSRGLPQQKFGTSRDQKIRHRADFLEPVPPIKGSGPRVEV